MPTLEEFLKTGAIGPIRGGMTYAEVVAALGPPQSESVKRKPRVLKYGPLQLSLYPDRDRTDRVSLIALYPRQSADALPPAVRVALDPLGCRQRFQTFLGETELTPTAVSSDPVDQVVLPGGVKVVFDVDAVHGVFAPANSSVAPTRQLTVTLTDDTMNALTVMAKAQQRRSVAELASSLLTSQVAARTE
jgi:hypothetical protein